MGGVNVAPDYVETMRIGHINAAGDVVITNSLRQGGIVSVYYLGTLTGCLIGGVFGDRYGRINTIGLGTVWAILGASLQSSAQGHVWMICKLSSLCLLVLQDVC